MICLELTNQVIDLLKTRVGEYGNMKSSETFEKEILEICRKINEENARLLYHVITEDAYVLDEADQEIIMGNLSRIERIIKKDYIDSNSCWPKQRAVLIKIFDHFRLVIHQKKEIKDKVETLDSRIEKADKMTEEIDDKFKSVNFDVVSILGIFTGIAFIAFGGIQMASSLGQLTSNGENLMNVIFSIAIIAMVIINTVIIFMQYVKIISRNIIRNEEEKVFDLIFKPKIGIQTTLQKNGKIISNYYERSFFQRIGSLVVINIMFIIIFVTIYFMSRF